MFPHERPRTASLLPSAATVLLAVSLLTSCSTTTESSSSSGSTAAAGRYDQSSLANQLDRDLDQPLKASQPNPMATRNDMVRAMESGR